MTHAHPVAPTPTAAPAAQPSAPASGVFRKTNKGLKPLAAATLGVAIASALVLTVVVSAAKPVKDPDIEKAISAAVEKQVASMPTNWATLSAEPSWLETSGKALHKGRGDAGPAGKVGEWMEVVSKEIRGSRAWTKLIPLTGSCPIVVGQSGVDEVHTFVPKISREEAAKWVVYHEASHCQDATSSSPLKDAKQREAYADVRATLLQLRENPLNQTTFMLTLPLYRELSGMEGDRVHDTSAELQKLGQFLTTGVKVQQLKDVEIDGIARTLAEGKSLTGFRVLAAAEVGLERAPERASASRGDRGGFDRG